MSFGIFESLTQYGILGFAVLGLGYLCWIFLNRLMKSEDDYRKRVEDLETDIRNDVDKTIKSSTESAKSLKETILIFLSNKK
jgi:hypothetical protein